jgi:hypothetical protein
MIKMTNKRIRLAINWVLKKGETTANVANDFKSLSGEYSN